ncbi:MAG: type II toxin-antitoxin system RelE/ParE family toxin [Myxococcota bacterium]
MTTRVILEPNAQSELDELDSWWRVNRQLVPDQVLTEYDRIQGELAVTPEVGRVYESYESIRWVRLKKTPYLLFYEFDAERNEVRILSVWSGVRGSRPEFGERR